MGKSRVKPEPERLRHAYLRDLSKIDGTLALLETEPPSQSETGPPRRILKDVITAVETREIVAALKQERGFISKAARLLGVSRSRIYRRLEALGLDAKDWRRPRPS